MANLLDTIRQNSQPQMQGVTGETGKLQTLLRAKSGKAVAAPEVAASNQAEQGAVAQTNLALQQQVVPQANIQAAGLQQQQTGIQQAEQLQRGEIEQQKRFDTIQSKLKTDQLLNDLERNKGQIDLQRDKAAVNQLATNLRLQTQQYTDNLQREGSRARLNDSMKFQEELSKSILGDNRQLLEKDLAGKSVLSASDRDFKKAMAEMGVSDAYKMFKDDMAAARTGAMYSGAGALATAGIGAYGTYDESSSKEDYYTTGAGKDSESYEATKYRSPKE